MSYLKTDGASTVVKYPYTRQDFAAEYPNVSLFPKDGIPRDDQLAEFNIFDVVPATRPAPSNAITKNVVESTPTLVKGAWTQTWTEQDATADEIAARQKRATDVTDKGAIKAVPFVSTFIDMSPDQVSSYIQANVTDLASAKDLLDKVCLMLLLLARREFR